MMNLVQGQKVRFSVLSLSCILIFSKGDRYALFKCMFACRKRIVLSWTWLINMMFICSYQVLKHDKSMMKSNILFIISKRVTTVFQKTVHTENSLRQQTTTDEHRQIIHLCEYVYSYLLALRTLSNTSGLFVFNVQFMLSNLLTFIR